MRVARQLIAVSVMACLFSHCTMTPDQRFIRQKIPMEIQSAKPSTVKIGLSGNGWNEVGVRCSPQVWAALTSAGSSNITVRLISSNKQGTQIINVSPGTTHKLWPIEAYHYLFTIGGEEGANASVEISFPSVPEGLTPVEIIVLKTPIDTKFPNV
jgi:hypothetical protein